MTPTDKNQDEEVITIEHGADSDASKQVEIDVNATEPSPASNVTSVPVSSDITNKYSEEIKKISNAYNEEKSLVSKPEDEELEEKSKRDLFSNEFVAPEANPGMVVSSSDPAQTTEATESVPQEAQAASDAPHDSAPSYVYKAPEPAANTPATKIRKPIHSIYLALAAIIVVLLGLVLYVFFVKA